MKTLPPSLAVHQSFSDAALAEALAKLAPNRVHESSWLKILLCSLGLHRWHYPNLGGSIPPREVGVCRWCPKVKVRGVLYGE
ncbi:MAG: hypothetical protein WCF68_10060 [Terriglobales bacterium]